MQISYHNSSNFFKILAKPIELNCNCHCNYCFNLEIENLYPTYANSKMYFNVLESFIKLIIEAQEIDIVQMKDDQKMVDELKECGGNVNFTIYPEAGHDAWTETYNNQELYDWLLSCSRNNEN